MEGNRYDPDIHHRRTIRLKGFDYSTAGLYFVTVCTQGHERLFGGIGNGDMVMNEAGKMVGKIWRDLPERFAMVTLDEFVVMPNHFHGIIALNDHTGVPRVRTKNNTDGRGEPRVRPNDLGDHNDQGEHKVRPYGGGTCENSLGRVVQAFKSITTVEYVMGVKQSNWPPFPGRLWQRNYYERIIRDETELNNIRQYIINNPPQWAEDPENKPQQRR